MDKATLLSRRAEVIKQLEDLEAAELSKGKDPREHEDHRKWSEDLAKIDNDLEVLKAVEDQRSARQRDFGPVPQGPTIQQPVEQRRSFGEFLVNVVRAGLPNAERRATGLSTISGPDGGFLVDAQFSKDIFQKMWEQGAILNRCRRIQVSQGNNAVKIPYLKENNRTDGYAFGGVQAYWNNEGGTVTSTKPAIDTWSLDLLKMSALVYLTDEVMEDAPMMESLVRDVVPQAMVLKLEDAIFNGTGAGQPLGILTDTNVLVSQAKESGQTATTFNLANASKMLARLYAPSLRNAVWTINQDVFPQIYQLNSAATSAATPMFFPPGGIKEAPGGMLFGRPIVPTEHNATLGTVGDVVLADFSQYVIVEKGGIDVASSMHVQFIYGENVLRFTWRINGRPLWPSSLTPRKGSNTQGPFVALATRS